MIDVDLGKRIGDFELDVGFRNASGITALYGRSGSGKSMTLGLIAGLSHPDRGHVRIDDTTLVDVAAGIRVPMHKRRTGLVFQDSHLLPHLTVRQNLAFGRWFARRAEGLFAFDRVVDVLGIAGLLGRRPGALSGGERQRVAIGRALLANPRLLLLDEPFAALDRERKLEILPLIEQLRDTFAIPILYVSHTLEEVVRLAAHVVLMDGGKVVGQGTPAAVFGPSFAAEDLRFGRVSVVDATVGAPDEAYGLTAIHHEGGTLWLAGPAGREGARTRVLIKATDVSLAVGTPGPTSIRSALRGTIVAIESDGAFAVVEVGLVGEGRVVALVTRRAVADLALEVGRQVTALVKTVALDEGVAARL